MGKDRVHIGAYTIRANSIRSWVSRLDDNGIAADTLLSDKLHDVMIRHMYDGDSTAEIARDYGVSNTTVQNWLFGRRGSVLAILRGNLRRISNGGM